MLVQPKQLASSSPLTKPSGPSSACEIPASGWKQRRGIFQPTEHLLCNIRRKFDNLAALPRAPIVVQNHRFRLQSTRDTGLSFLDGAAHSPLDVPSKLAFTTLRKNFASESAWMEKFWLPTVTFGKNSLAKDGIHIIRVPNFPASRRNLYSGTPPSVSRGTIPTVHMHLEQHTPPRLQRRCMCLLHIYVHKNLRFSNGHDAHYSFAWRSILNPLLYGHCGRTKSLKVFPVW